MTVQQAIKTIVSGATLSEEQAFEAARQIIAGESTPAQIAGLLVALRMRGESVDEIVGFARAMRQAATPIPVRSDRLVDTCGTGGDGRGTFNISTVAAIVAAGAGCHVAKHGNRWISSRCGSADVLTALGVNVEVAPEVSARCVDEIGLGFLFAPLYHPGTRHAAGPRRELGIRSLFNILGPLSNPAGALRQVMGVFDAGLTPTLAEVFRRLGSAHVLVVAGEDGMDEFSISGPTRVAELREREVRRMTVTPEDVGLSRAPIEALRGGDAEENARIARRVLEGEKGPARDVVALNAGAVVYASGSADTIEAGVRQAERAIDSGAARAKLDALVAITGGAG